MKPTIGRIVIYVDKNQVEWPAIVVRVRAGEEGDEVWLTQFRDDNIHPTQFWKNPVPESTEQNAKGEYPKHTWHWPVIEKDSKKKDK